MQLSVIIPTYNRKDSLQRLLWSLTKQINVELEIIVIDQNPRGFFETGYFDGLEQVRFVELQIPNVSAARNLGFCLSRAKSVVFIDDDLLPEVDFCVKGIEVFEKYNFIESFVPHVYCDDKSQYSNTPTSKVIPHTSNFGDIFLILDTISACVFFRRNAFIKYGGFNPYHFEFARTGEDQEFFLRMNKKGGKLWYCNSLSVFHDEKVAGGCELRTQDYWITRKKCLRGIVMRLCFQRYDGKLRIMDFLEASRFILLNSKILSMSPSEIIKNVKLYFVVIDESSAFIEARGWSNINKESYLELI